jgi:hypothetical protein
VDTLCILCESLLPVGTSIVEVTATKPGTLCASCTALSAAERDTLRTNAMTRMLVKGR